MNDLKNFLNETEDFQNKNLLFIFFDKSSINLCNFLGKDNNLVIKIIYNFLTNTSLTKSELLSFTRRRSKKNNFYDYIFINSSNGLLNKKIIIKYLKEIKFSFKDGSRIFISQKIFTKQKRYLLLKSNNIFENSFISRNLLLYDYCFFRILFRVNNKKNLRKKIIIFLTKLLKLNEVKKLIRFKFLANILLVKYIYIPDFKNKN